MKSIKYWLFITKNSERSLGNCKPTTWSSKIGIKYDQNKIKMCYLINILNIQHFSIIF